MTYHEWLERFASLTPETRANLRRKILVLDHQPLISVILPVYNSDLKFLERAIASVRRQIYENWEVCLADDASTDLRIKPFLENLTARRSSDQSPLSRQEWSYLGLLQFRLVARPRRMVRAPGSG